MFLVEQIDNATSWFEDSIIYISPEQNWNGQLNIQFSVSDDIITIFESFTLNVLPINDSPIANSMYIRNEY